VSGRLRAFYFLYWSYVGASLGYLAPYLRGLGFSGDAIGAVAMASQLVSAPAGLFWAHTADLRAAREKTLRRCALGALCAIAFLPLNAWRALPGRSVSCWSSTDSSGARSCRSSIR